MGNKIRTHRDLEVYQRAFDAAINSPTQKAKPLRHRCGWSSL